MFLFYRSRKCCVFSMKTYKPTYLSIINIGFLKFHCGCFYFVRARFHVHVPLVGQPLFTIGPLKVFQLFTKLLYHLVKIKQKSTSERDGDIFWYLPTRKRVKENRFLSQCIKPTEAQHVQTRAQVQIRYSLKMLKGAESL